MFTKISINSAKAFVVVNVELSHDGDLVEHYEEEGHSTLSPIQPLTSFLLGLAEHTSETKEEDDYGKGQFGNQAGVVFDFGHQLDVPYIAALRACGYEKTKEQERTLEYYHPPDKFVYGSEME